MIIYLHFTQKPQGYTQGLAVLRWDDGYIYLREDTVSCIYEYLHRRGPVPSDRDCEPLFVSLTKSDAVHGRITRIGLSK